MHQETPDPDLVSARPPLTRRDVARLREDFPILAAAPGERPLVYLDNAATSQKPRPVIETVARFYSSQNANVNRGVYALGARATGLFEQARAGVQRFLGATSPREIVFTGGATEAVNLVAQTYARNHLRPGDEILVTTLEHHSNFVPWQRVCIEKDARLAVAPIDDDGNLALETIDALINERTRLVALTHVSNVLGAPTPVRDVVALAHARGVPVFLDGAQSAPRLPIDVRALGCDFFVCSGHKMFGPDGIGVLYGREEILETMPPWQTGGGMIDTISNEAATFAGIPTRFEAGTPPIAGALGLAAAIAYLEAVGMDRIAAYERELVVHAQRVLEQTPGVRVLAGAARKVGIVSFLMEGVHPHDLAQVLDADGIAIRAGHHCALPLMRRLGVAATARVSLAFYNTLEELDALGEALRRAAKVLR